MNETLDSLKLSATFGELLKKHQWLCAVAESCTGGGLAAIITEIAGSSQWFDRGFITYTNKAKQEMLDVPASMLLSEGAVSEATVCAMAKGAIHHSHAQMSIAISGIAGPGGGSDEKPVGTVWIAWAIGMQQINAQHYFFKGDRQAIRHQAIQMALKVAIDWLLRL